MSCECGCGRPVREGRRFVCGHHNHLRRLSSRLWEERDCGYRTPCWVWVRSISTEGYGELRVRGFTTKLAHRIFYVRFHGPIPPGLEPDHLCRNRACVHPGHLELVTRKTNARRGARAKLTEESAAEIRRRSEAGEDALALAGEFGVSRQTIYSVRSGIVWA